MGCVLLRHIWTYFFLISLSLYNGLLICLNDLGGKTHYNQWYSTYPNKWQMSGSILERQNKCSLRRCEVNLFKLPAFIWYGSTHYLPLLSAAFHCSMYKTVVVKMQLKDRHNTDPLVLSNHQGPNKKQTLLRNTNPSEFTHIFIQVFTFVQSTLK